MVADSQSCGLIQGDPSLRRDQFDYDILHRYARKMPVSLTFP
jgi:hypothetical protein